MPADYGIQAKICQVLVWFNGVGHMKSNIVGGYLRENFKENF